MTGQTIRDGMIFALPLFIMAVGGIFSERSGMVNLALEGIQGIGAFTGALSALIWIHLSGNNETAFYLSILLAMAGGMLYALLFSSLCIKMKANQVIAGVVMNILAAALTSFLTKYINRSLFGNPSDKFVLNVAERFSVPFLSEMPFVGVLFTNVYFFELIIVVTGFGAWYILYKTRFGMHLRACGDNPHAVDAAGIGVNQVRYTAAAISGALSGLAGISFAYSILGNFSASIYAGYGYLSIAAMIFGNWKILPALFACLLFGIARSSGYTIVQGLSIPGSYSELVMILPYVLTLILLIFLSKYNHPPRALGEVYEKGKR